MRKLIIKLIAGLGTVALLAVSLPAMATPDGGHTTYGPMLNASACNAGGSPIVNVTYKVTNDSDSGVAGNAWANDNYNKSVKVFDQGGGNYCAVVKFQGQFVTFAGASPENTGTVAAGVHGTIDGGYDATFTAPAFTPTLATNGQIAAYNYHCDMSFNCPGEPDIFAAYFPGYTNFNQYYWAWNYHAGHNGSWTNAITGNSGDITGN